MPSRTPRGHMLAAATLCLGLALGAATLAVPSSASGPEDSFAPQLVTVDTADRAAKERLQELGLDLTEHAGHDYVEVVLHTVSDRDALTAAGFTYDVRIPDLVAREAQINEANKRYAATTVRSALPSARDTYRSLSAYNNEMKRLAADNPGLVRLFTLSEPSLDGRTVYGVEIASNVAASDGRPTFAMFGLHHAREWPSGEHAMEFAYELVKAKLAGNKRISRLLDRGRMVIVPVANPDGFHLSFTDGQAIDLRTVDGGGTVSILATPGNAYKRKNCRVVDGQDTPDGTCAVASATSPGGFGIGVDTNRNYGGLWGGPGAAEEFVDPTYRGAGPFSEPETRNVQRLISGRQVTMMVSNHTFSNLVLRPNGVTPTTIGPDGHPVGNAPDEEAMKELGARMTAQNGYRNIHGWELYDTTGTTEDWSYNTTGGYGYTFEIGPNEFHPPYSEVVDEYAGAGEFAGKGNREAYLLAFENAVDRDHHAVISGKAPSGATLRLTKTVTTPTWNNAHNYQDTLASSMVVGGKQFTWDINQSTRPIVMSRTFDVLDDQPARTETFTGTPGSPTGATDEDQSPRPSATEHEFVVTETGMDLMRVRLDWPTPDDLDLNVFRVDSAGERTLVGSSGNVPGEKEEALISGPTPGTYVLQVINYASATPSYTLTAELFDATTMSTPGGLVESYALTCEKNGTVLQELPVTVARGQQVRVNLSECAARW